MRVVVECLEDGASVNMAQRLRELAPWTEGGLFEGRRVLSHGDLRLVTVEEMHITNENLHERFPASLQGPEAVIFLSRHRAQSGTASLTVHPIGNWGEAPYGGKPGSVVPTSPAWMGGLLLFLKGHAPPGYEVSLEATHHGPYIEAPTLFLELGSGEIQWQDAAAARVLARAVLEAQPSGAPPVLWVGGGHYCPQLTDLVLAGKVAPGHVVAGWAAAEPIADEALRQGVEGTPACKGFVLQRKATKVAKALADRLGAMGVARLDPAAL